MPPLVALLIAASASLPAFALSYFLVSGRHRPVEQAWAGFLATAPVAVPIYFLGALLVGSILWATLKAMNMLTLPALLVGSVVPVLVLVFGQAALRGGVGPGVQVVIFAFGLPCVVIAATLWLFGIRFPIGA